jgi:hypothetical protein
MDPTTEPAQRIPDFYNYFGADHARNSGCDRQCTGHCCCYDEAPTTITDGHFDTFSGSRRLIGWKKYLEQ